MFDIITPDLIRNNETVVYVSLNVVGTYWIEKYIIHQGLAMQILINSAKSKV